MYNKKLPKITDTVDSVLDEDMEDLMILWTCYLMFLSVEKSAKAQLCLSQYTIAKDAAVWQSLYDDDSITFDINRSTTTSRDNVL